MYMCVCACACVCACLCIDVCVCVCACVCVRPRVRSRVRSRVRVRVVCVYVYVCICVQHTNLMLSAVKCSTTIQGITTGTNSHSLKRAAARQRAHEYEVAAPRHDAGVQSLLAQDAQQQRDTKQHNGRFGASHRGLET